ncbi:hypothetical protein AB6V67_10600 [Serratia marcescens]|uniref:hypothetical protein n=1 Tax=Serratia TaxID=613 RepID=UPI00345B89E4|nr:hypothetical protein [Serratia marcescens]
MTLNLKSNKRALNFISPNPLLPKDFKVAFDFEGERYKDGSGSAIKANDFIKYSRTDVATVINDEAVVKTYQPNELTVLQLYPSGESGLFMPRSDEDAYLALFNSPLTGGEVTFTFPNLVWRNYQFAMMGTGKATITVIPPTGVTMTKYASALPSGINQLAVDALHPTACSFSNTGSSWSIKVQVTGRVDQLFMTRAEPSGAYMIHECCQLVKPSSSTPSTLRTANVYMAPDKFETLFSNGGKTGTLVFSLYLPREQNVNGQVGVNPSWLVSLLFSDGSDFSCNGYFNPGNDLINIARYRVNDMTAQTEKVLRLLPDRFITIAVAFDNGAVRIACNKKFYDEAVLSTSVGISAVNFGSGIWGDVGVYNKGNMLLKQLYAYSRALSPDELLNVSGLFM